MSDKYILNSEGNPVPADLKTWAEWFETATRKVADETVGDMRVSTVFLGINHGHRPDGPPILWETMIFGGALDQDQDRCSGNREQAEAMHARMVEKALQALSKCRKEGV